MYLKTSLFASGVLTLCASIIVLAADRSDPSSAKDALVVFLVRHAEKVDASADPKLSAAGVKRAEQLAQVLRDANIKHIHSSDFIRTRDTAAPLASRLKLKVQIYDARNLPALVARLKKVGGRHLVVGHSSTTPRAVKMLGGEAGSQIDEKGEFDRLYVVTANGGKASSVLMRYGAPFRK